MIPNSRHLHFCCTNEDYERSMGCQSANVCIIVSSILEVSKRFQHTMADYGQWLIAKVWPTSGEDTLYFFEREQ